MVTDQAVLNDSTGTAAPRFTMRALMHQLAIQAGAGQTEDQMFRQWWDVFNPAPGLSGDPGANVAPHCSDNGNTLNGFPYSCRAAEGGQALPTSTVKIDNYIPIALANRFDVAPTDGSNCGEYRIIFAMPTVSVTNRSLVIFEAALPNPQPTLGLQGCVAVQQFWADLAKDNIPSSRAVQLRNFYFNGLPGFSPVIHVDNYGKSGGQGQVRVNIFRQANWNLREFKLQPSASCTTGPCKMDFVPVTVKTNPAPILFQPVPTPGSPNANMAPLVASFQSDFIEQVPSLAIQDINRFNYNMDDKYNIGSSDSQADVYGRAPTPASATFLAAITAALPPSAVSAGVTAQDILSRAETQSCAGCHQQMNARAIGGGMTWPSTSGFVHVSEMAQENGPDGPRFAISAALKDVFLPFRVEIMRNFLASSQTQAAPQWGTAVWNEGIWQ